MGEEGDNEESIQEDIRDRIQGDIVDSVDWTENHEETRREKFDFRNPARILWAPTFWPLQPIQFSFHWLGVDEPEMKGMKEKGEEDEEEEEEETEEEEKKEG